MWRACPSHRQPYLGRSLVRDACPAVLWHISHTIPLRARRYRDSTLYVNYRPHQTRAQKWTICRRLFQAGQAPVICPARATVRVLKSDRSSWSALAQISLGKVTEVAEGHVASRSALNAPRCWPWSRRSLFGGSLRPVRPLPSRGLPCNAILILSGFAE